MKGVSSFALLALAACATISPAPPESLTAGFGQVARAGILSVRPLGLLEDSRCPVLVRCVWAGQVRITAEIAGPTGRAVRELTLGQPLPVDGGTVTLVAVEPAKLMPGTTDPAAYRFTFRFER